MTLFPKCCGCRAGKGWSKDPSRQGETRGQESALDSEGPQRQPSLQPQEEVLMRLQPKGVGREEGNSKAPEHLSIRSQGL